MGDTSDAYCQLFSALQATVVVFGIFFCMKTGIFTLCVCVCVCLCVCGCVCGEATGAVNVR